MIKTKFMAVCMILVVLCMCVEEDITTKTTQKPKPPTTTIVRIKKSHVMIDETTVLSAREYISWTIPRFWSDYENGVLELTFNEVSGSDANFYIVDERGLEHFKRKESFYSIFKREDVVYFSITMSVPEGEHYMIIDNTDSWFREKNVHLKVVLYWEETQVQEV